MWLLLFVTDGISKHLRCFSGYKWEENGFVSGQVVAGLSIPPAPKGRTYQLVLPNHLKPSFHP